MFTRTAAIACLSLALYGSAAAQTQPAVAKPKAEDKAASPSWKISGYMFGDYYNVLEHHNTALKGQNGFWFRRMYLTYDNTMTKRVSTRLRLEMNSPGTFTTKGTLTPYVKDAYVRYAAGRHSVSFGIAPTPTWEFIEGFWGLRAVEKTPLDLYKWDSSRDFGILALGALNASKTVGYSFQVGNGSSTQSESDKGKVVRGALNYRSKQGFVAEGYLDKQDRAGRADYSTWQLFAGIQKPKYRLGAQYAAQTRQPATATGADLNLEMASVFAAATVAPRVSLFARVDRNFDPVPGGETIDYVAISDKATSTMTILGVDISVDKPLRLIPSVAIVTYGEDAKGVRVGKDVITKMTVYFTW